MPKHALLLTLALGCGAAGGAPEEPTATPQVTTTNTRVAASVASVQDLQVAFKEAIAKAGPAVVSVYSTKTVSMTGGPGGPGGMDPFEFFFGRPGPGGFGGPQEFQQQGLGSGFIFDAQGHILTNNHVVEKADEIRVELSDGREFEAKLVGADPATDLAVLSIEAKDLQPVELGNSDEIEAGDWVLAIGNPFGLPQTVSSGIVSAVGRANVGIVDYENFIQTDAAVNPGNSGGPLVDLAGRVVGINTAIASRSGGNNGIAFAIPVDMAKQIVEQLLTDGKVTRGHLGVLISDLTPELAQSFGYQGTKGALVQDVQEGSPAAEAGLQSGDIVLSLDGKTVEDMQAFRSSIARIAPDTMVELEVWRDGKTRRIGVKLGEQPGKPGVSAPTDEATPKLGIGLQDLTPQLRQQLDAADATGAVIAQVQPGSPAAKAGLRPGDIIEKVGSQPVQSADEVVKLLSQADLKAGVRLRVIRGGMGHFVFVQTKD